MTPAEAKDYIHDQITAGIMVEIEWAERAKTIAYEIGKYAAPINAAHFGNLFFDVQLAMSDRQSLSITKMYDPPHGQFPTRSIPALLAFLKKHAVVIQIEQPHVLHNLLLLNGQSPYRVARLREKQITLDVVKHYQKILPHTAKDPALEAIRLYRNKLAAHNQRYDQARQRVKWDEADKLVDAAKSFIQVISYAYVGLYLGTSLDMYQASSLKCAQLADELRRLVERANLSPKQSDE